MAALKTLGRGGLVTLAIVLAAHTPAAAQMPEEGPIGRFVIDARGSLPFFGQDPLIASGLGVPQAALPSRGLGLTVGGHVYFARWRVMTFGAGADLHVSRGRREPATDPDATGPALPTLRTRFSAFAPALSFNFGGRQGWSYISGGIGRSTLTVTREPDAGEAEPAKTINYGGGARWFTSEHVAFSLDVRLYAINPQPASATSPASSRKTLFVLSVGASFK